MENYENKAGDAKFPEDIKRTKQREKIFRILFCASKPMSAADIYQCILKSGVNTGFAISTVYRVLSVFEKMGYVTKSALMDEDMSYYEWNRGGHTHYAVCLKCHKLIPLEDCPFEHAQIHPAEKGFCITGHKLELYGFCKGCQS